MSETQRPQLGQMVQVHSRAEHGLKRQCHPEPDLSCPTHAHDGRQRRFVEVLASQDGAADAEGANRLLQVEPRAII